MSSSRSFLGRFTVLLSRRVAIEAGVVTATDDDVERYAGVLCITAAGDELTGVVVSAFLFTPFFAGIPYMQFITCYVFSKWLLHH